jgi:predicted XRE-type DNA-binding protein
MSQNIFFESGFSDEDATVMALETDAAIAIARYIRDAFPNNQTGAAKHLGIGQNEVSAILAGSTSRFSLAKLLKVARRARIRLYLDMGDNAHGASAVTLLPNIAITPLQTATANPSVDVYFDEQLKFKAASTGKDARPAKDIH